MVASFLDWGPAAIVWVASGVLIVMTAMDAVADRRKRGAERQAAQDHRDTLDQMRKPPQG
jgi:hypothetical protein